MPETLEHFEELNFEQISDPKSPFFDAYWFESDILPEEHPWFSLIGDFLYMKVMVAQHEYTGNNFRFRYRSGTRLKRFHELTPVIEEFIRNKQESLSLAEAWSDYCRSFDALRIIKNEQLTREKRGQYDRGSERRRAWFSCVFLNEKIKGRKGPDIKRDIATLAEKIKSGEIATPEHWKEGVFEKLLHEDSNTGSPGLALTYQRKMREKVEIPYYANEVAPKFEMPSTDLKDYPLVTEG